MQGNPNDHHDMVEHLDADAVCEACGNVNPEGTLLCKTCGNNLRDQRTRRMQAGGPVADAGPSIQIGNIVRGVLMVAGILLVLWTALNVSTIESWLLGVQSVEAKGEGAVDPETFWTGPDATQYDELTDTLTDQAVTIEEAGAVPPGAPLASLDGRYVLKRSTESAASPVGSAIIKQAGDKWFFVALLVGGTEIRGAAQKTSDTMFQAYSIGILNMDDTYTEAFGYGQVQATGEIDCSGLFGEYETPANITAIPVSPEGEAAAASPPEAAPEADTAPAGEAPAGEVPAAQ